MNHAHEALTAAASFGVVPVVEIDDIANADALAEALLEGGLGVVEVTFRTAAADIIARLSDRYPGLLVGAGTVVTASDLERAHQAGARFALAPGYSQRLVTSAAEIGLPYVPGVMTPSELQVGLEQGVRNFKFFPAVPAGGLDLLRAIAAPFVLHGPRFIPTGGVKQSTLAAWLHEPAVAAVGGTWIASRAMIRDGDWAAIRAAAAAVATAREVRDGA